MSRETRPCHINRLPNEVLSGIFRFCNICPTIGHFETKEINDINTGSVTASHVSSRWRSITLVTPSLWSKFFINISSVSSEEVPPSLEALISLHLGRSKDAALDICIMFSELGNYGYESDGDEEEGEDGEDGEGDEENGVKRARKLTLPILSDLLQHAHRWRRAILKLPESKALDNTVFPKTFPLLQELDVRCIPLEDPGNTFLPEFLAPQLRELVVEKFDFNGGYGSSCLKELSLDWVTPATAADFLEGVPAQCKVNVSNMFSPRMAFDYPSFVSQLRSLSIVGTNKEEWDAPLDTLLDSMTLPNLEELTFIDENSRCFPDDGLLSMFRRSESSLIKLNHLRFDGCRISDEDLLRVLEQLPGLTFFTFVEAYPDEEQPNPLTAHFFRRLATNHILLVPSLSGVELGFSSKSIPLADLCSFFEYRLSTINRVKLSVQSKHISNALMDGLSELCSTGLEVEICVKTAF